MNEKGTREKNDGNEDVSMDDTEKIEVSSICWGSSAGGGGGRLLTPMY